MSQHDGAAFEQVEWTDDSSRFALAPRTISFLLSLAGLLVVFLYDWQLTDRGIPIIGWGPSRTEYLFLASLVVLAHYVVWPLIVDHHRRRQIVTRIRSDPIALVSAVAVLLFVLVGIVGPPLLGNPTVAGGARFQPPVWGTIDTDSTTTCVGEVTTPNPDEPWEKLCHGSWKYPMGTDRIGRDVIHMTVMGAGVALKVALIAGMLMVPIAMLVGTLAGYLGGRTDAVLMGYVDIQQTVPAILIYLIAIYFYPKSLFLIVLIFGLLNWGGVARVVRGEVLQRRQADYVRAARNAGAGHLQVIRRHILPNVSNTVVTATTRQMPMLILAEAALSFLRLNNVGLWSWGVTISTGLRSTGWASVTQQWYISTLPVLALAVTVLAISIFGDTLRDVLDPRAETS